MFCASIIGTLCSTITAVLMGYSKEDIDKGLYGFNGTLVGIGAVVFCGFSYISIIIIILGAALSTLIAYFFKKLRIPGYTFPFVLVVWVVILLSNAGYLPQPINKGASVATETFDFWSDLSYSIGQVMLQADSLLTGALFLLAIIIASRDLALYAIVGLTLSLLVALFDLFPVADINAGLYGYNAVLVAMALGAKSIQGFIKIALGVLLSILLQYIGINLGLSTLTAPFVFATWIVIGCSHLLERNKRKSSSLTDP